MITSRDPTFAFTMTAEGGDSVSMDPEDNGNWSSNEAGVGRLIGSKYGVSAIDLIEYLSPATVTAETMAAISEATAEAIWEPQYFAALRCADLPLGIDLMTADHGYNRGVSAAGRVLQSVCGAFVDGWIGPDTVTAAKIAAATKEPTRALSPDAAKGLQRALRVTTDGIFGPASQAALTSCNRAWGWALAAVLADAQAADYRTLAQFPRYGAGWLSRVWARLDAALALPGA